MTVDVLTWLQKWYSARCDGHWEHSLGITVETLDNPGWKVSVDLADTDLAGANMEEIKINRSDADWLVYGIRDSRFMGACGPQNLIELLRAFREIASTFDLEE